MFRYGDESSNSGVVAYSLGDDFIVVQFANQTRGYIFTHATTGQEHVDNMKRHAIEGEGLATYINQHNPKYEDTIKLNPIG